MKADTHLESQWKQALMHRERAGYARRLHILNPHGVDFCTNDYLGYSRSERLASSIENEMARIMDQQQHGHDHNVLHRLNGSGGSRLVSGNHAYYETVESELASFYETDAAVLFNSGYDANLGLISCIPQQDTVILFDALVHNSCREGFRLSRAKSYEFNHNDIVDARDKVRAYLSRKEVSSIIIVVESVYSMDGDTAPLKELARFASTSSNVHLIVDEAHSTGIYAENGSGLVNELGLRDQVLCTVNTFGKAMGIHGAVVCGSQLLKSYLINYARPLIYSTALSTHLLVSIRCAHMIVQQDSHGRNQLRTLIQYFRDQCQRSGDIPNTVLYQSTSAIQALQVAGNHRVTQAAAFLTAKGFNVYPIRSPTVAVGSERLRVVIHVHNSHAEVDAFLTHFGTWLRLNKEEEPRTEISCAKSKL